MKIKVGGVYACKHGTYRIIDKEGGSFKIKFIEGLYTQDHSWWFNPNSNSVFEPTHCVQEPPAHWFIRALRAFGRLG